MTVFPNLHKQFPKMDGAYINQTLILIIIIIIIIIEDDRSTSYSILKIKKSKSQFTIIYFGEAKINYIEE